VDGMNTFLEYLFVIALFALIALPSLVGYARDRAIDRQLRQAELRQAGPRQAALRQAGPRSASPKPRAWSRPDFGGAPVKAPCH
jgi:hypothetical protein